MPIAAIAHAVLVTSVPAARAVLGSPPPRVELEFSERLEPAYSTLSVWNERGERVDGNAVPEVAANGRRLVLAVPVLAPGRYTVRYRVLSVDGHVVDASVPFTIAPRAAR
ncbi:MAG TPA: copper resistance CopC family protein [Methylomirabilota bacterium]